MKIKSKTSLLLKLGSSAAGLIVLLVILVAVNTIVSQLRVRKDFTSEKLYTLSDGSRKVLGKLDRDVTLMFFFNSSSAEVPAPLKSFAQQVEDLLKEYEIAGGGRVVLEKYDPKPDSDAEDLAQRYGLAGQAL
ncbi:MAG: Gldg family protein, partial [bacterium]